MEKKNYKSPKSVVVKLDAIEILAGSDGTGATIPDAGWGNAKERSSYDYIFDDENE